MASANMIISQAGSATPAGKSNDTLAVATAVDLRNQDDNGVKFWKWTLVERPPDSTTAVMTTPNGAQTSFTPDVDGTYVVSLQVNSGTGGEFQQKVAVVRTAITAAALTARNLRIMASAETNEADWAAAEGKGYYNDLHELFDMTREVYVLVNAGGGPPTLSSVLGIGNVTGGTDISVTTGDKVIAPAELTLECGTKFVIATTSGVDVDVFTDNTDPTSSQGPGSLVLVDGASGGLFIQMKSGGGAQWRGLPGGQWKSAPTLIGAGSATLVDGQQIAYDPTAGKATISLPDVTSIPDAAECVIFNSTTVATAANLDINVDGGGNLMHPLSRAVVTSAVGVNAPGRCMTYKFSAVEALWYLKGIT